MTTDCPTVGVCLVLEVTPLTTGATCARGFPQVVEDMREPKVDPGFGIIVIGLEGWFRSRTIEPRASDAKLGVT